MNESQLKKVSIFHHHNKSNIYNACKYIFIKIENCHIKLLDKLWWQGSHKKALTLCPLWSLKKSGGVYWGKTTGNMKSSEIEVNDIVSNTDILLLLLLLLIIITIIIIILMLVLLLLLGTITAMTNKSNNN